VSRRVLFARAAAVLALWVLACAAMWVLGARPEPGLVGLTVLGALATWAVLRLGLSGTEAGEARWRVPTDEPVRPPGRDPRLDLLVRLVDAHLAARRADPQLARQLVRLTDQRLVARHGVSRLADPGRALALLGPELTALVEQVERVERGGPAPRLTPQAVDVVLTRIEAI
jgi:hypothetical protein